jgi:hypothetical protein
VNLRDIFEEIRAERGVLTVDDALDAAKAAATPAAAALRDRLEWDDAVAGEEYRKAQIAGLIRSVRMRVVYREADPETGDPGESQRVRTFHALPRTGERRMAYRPLEEIAADPVATEVLLRQAEREWRSLWAKYRNLEAFRSLVARDLGAPSKEPAAS